MNFFLSAKAVADGAAIWAVARSVDARAAQYAYGIQVLAAHDKNDAQHAARPVVIQASGAEMTSHGWSEIVPQVTLTISKDNSGSQAVE